jgi:hypothetical protein
VATFVIGPEADVARTSTTIDSDAPDAREKPVNDGEQVAPHVTDPAD